MKNANIVICSCSPDLDCEILDEREDAHCKIYKVETCRVLAPASTSYTGLYVGLTLTGLVLLLCAVCCCLNRQTVSVDLDNVLSTVCKHALHSRNCHNCSVAPLLQIYYTFLFLGLENVSAPRVAKPDQELWQHGFQLWKVLIYYC